MDWDKINKMKIQLSEMQKILLAIEHLYDYEVLEGYVHNINSIHTEIKSIHHMIQASAVRYYNERKNTVQ